MKDRRDLAIELIHGGMNCAQAVILVFKDELDAPETLLKQAGAAFGGGMGCLGATCGALCGAQIVLGLKKYKGTPIKKDAADLLKSFEKMCGASNCRELKGLDTGVVLCRCEDCVRNAVALVQERIKDPEGEGTPRDADSRTGTSAEK